MLSDNISQFSLDGKIFTFTLSKPDAKNKIYKSHVVCLTADLVKLYEFTDEIPDINKLRTFTPFLPLSPPL